MQHGDEDDAILLLDKEQVMVLATVAANAVGTRNRLRVRPACCNPVTALVQRLLISIGLFLAPGRVGIEPDVEKVDPGRAREAVGCHFRLCAAPGRRV